MNRWWHSIDLIIECHCSCVVSHWQLFDCYAEGDTDLVEVSHAGNVILPWFAQNIAIIRHHHCRVPQSSTVDLISLQNGRHHHHVVFFGQLQNENQAQIVLALAEWSHYMTFSHMKSLCLILKMSNYIKLYKTISCFIYFYFTCFCMLVAPHDFDLGEY